jgi:hypothetical protein
MKQISIIMFRLIMIVLAVERSQHAVRQQT